MTFGKLTLPRPIQEFFAQQLRLNQIEILRVVDRLIIAQSLAEDIQILNVDTIFDEYGVNRTR